MIPLRHEAAVKDRYSAGALSEDLRNKHPPIADKSLEVVVSNCCSATRLRQPEETTGTNSAAPSAASQCGSGGHCS